MHLPTPKTSPVVRYEFPVASRHKATATRFSTGMARLMFVSCPTKCGPTKLQTNWKVRLEIRKCSCQMLSAYSQTKIFSNQNCGLSRTHAVRNCVSVFKMIYLKSEARRFLDRWPRCPDTEIREHTVVQKRVQIFHWLNQQ